MFIQLLTYTRAASGEEKIHWEFFLLLKEENFARKISKQVTGPILTQFVEENIFYK